MARGVVKLEFHGRSSPVLVGRKNEDVNRSVRPIDVNAIPRPPRAEVLDEPALHLRGRLEAPEDDPLGPSVDAAKPPFRPLPVLQAVKATFLDLPDFVGQRSAVGLLGEGGASPAHQRRETERERYDAHGRRDVGEAAAPVKTRAGQTAHERWIRPSGVPYHSHMIRALTAALLAAFAVGFAPTAARATVVRPLTVAALTEQADAVVRARVGEQWSDWAEGGRRIFTWTQLEVLEAWTGDVGEAVVVRTMGGVVGDIGMRVSGTPRFATGAEVVVFLRAGADVFEVVGMSQGKFDVRGGDAIPDVHGLAFADHDPDAPTPPLPTLPVADLRTRVLARAGLLPLAPPSEAPSAPLAPPAPGAPDAPAGVEPPAVPPTLPVPATPGAEPE